MGARQRAGGNREPTRSQAGAKAAGAVMNHVGLLFTAPVSGNLCPAEHPRKCLAVHPVKSLAVHLAIFLTVWVLSSLAVNSESALVVYSGMSLAAPLLLLLVSLLLASLSPHLSPHLSVPLLPNLATVLSVLLLVFLAIHLSRCPGAFRAVERAAGETLPLVARAHQDSTLHCGRCVVAEELLRLADYATQTGRRRRG